MKNLRGSGRRIAFFLLILLLSPLLVSCTLSVEEKNDIDDFHLNVYVLSEYSPDYIEEELSTIRWYLDDSGDYREVTRADAQEAYKTIAAFLDEFDQELNSFVSKYKNYRNYR